MIIEKIIPGVIKKWYNLIFHHSRLKKMGTAYHFYNLQRKYGPQKQICYAAKKNMYFGSNGNVSSCCMNKEFILGNVKEQSVAEIWKGKKIIELRGLLENNVFLNGCKHCKRKIENENYDAVDSNLFDTIPLNRSYPTMLEFELSNECNLECIMCFPEFSSSLIKNNVVYDNQAFSYGTDFLMQIEEFLPHLHTVKFLGGEPFLISIYYKIWENIIKVNPKCTITVQTNGTVLNSKIKTLLNKGNFNILVSIDSFEKATYETIRKNANFDKVLTNIKYFSAYTAKKKAFFGISVCPMQQNWRELPQIVNTVNRFNANIYFHNVWKPDSCSLYSLQTDELREVISFLSKATINNSNKTEKKNAYHFYCYVLQLKNWLKEKEKKIKEKENIEALWLQNKAYFNSLSIVEIFQILKMKIEKEADSSDSVVNKGVNLGLCLEKIERIIDYYFNDPDIKKFIFDLIQKPSDSILTELENQSINVLIERAGKNLKKIKGENCDQ